LGARIPAGLEPKIFEVDTGSEYWDRGRVAALRPTSDASEVNRARGYRKNGGAPVLSEYLRISACDLRMGGSSTYNS